MNRTYLVAAIAVFVLAIGFMFGSCCCSKAEAAELTGEFRVTMAKAADQPIQWLPTYAASLDFGAPVDLGLALTRDGNLTGATATDVVDLYLRLPVISFVSADSTKRLSIETYLGTDLGQGTDVKSRSGAIGVIGNPGWKRDINVGLRGAWSNYDAYRDDGSKTSKTSFAVQALVSLPVGE